METNILRCYRLKNAVDHYSFNINYKFMSQSLQVIYYALQIPLKRSKTN